MSTKKTGEASNAEISRQRTPIASVRPRSAAHGVRLLRSRIEAGETAGRKQERERLSRALSQLEAEYERVERIVRPYGNEAQPGFMEVIGDADLPVFATTWEDTPRREELSYVPTPFDLIDVMLKLADIREDDVVYDLGCGDGRIAVAAARKHGAAAIGIDIDPQRIAEARELAKKDGVADRVSFHQGDLFDADLRGATGVTLYLLPSFNMELRPRLFDQLQPGARVVSHAFDMGDWRPAQALNVDGRQVYLWTMPDRSPEARDGAAALDGRASKRGET